MKRRLYLSFILPILLVLGLALITAACGGASGKIQSWEDLQTADEIERHTVDAKYLDEADPLMERAGNLSCLSEQPFYEHLSYFNVEEYPVEGQYLWQVGRTER